MMARILRLEWYKWRTRRDSRLSVAFLLLGTLGYGALLRLLIEADVTPVSLAALAGAEGSGFQLAYHTTRTLLHLLGLFMLLWGAASIAGEIEKGTHRLLLLRLPRRALALGKAWLLSIVAVLLAMIVLILSLGLGYWAYGLAPVRAGQILLHSTGSLLASGLWATLLSLLPLGAGLALGVCVSCMVRSTQAALSMTLVAAALLWALSLAPGVGAYLFPSTFAWPFDVALSRSEGLKTLSFAPRIWHHCAVNLAWIVALLGLGVLRFERRDLTS